MNSVTLIRVVAGILAVIVVVILVFRMRKKASLAWTKEKARSNSPTKLFGFNRSRKIAKPHRQRKTGRESGSSLLVISRRVCVVSGEVRGWPPLLALKLSG